MTYALFESLDGYIRKAERVLLVLPPKASVDAWSAMIGMKLYLESLDKEVLAVCEDHIPRQLEFLKLQNAAVKEILPDGDFVISLRTDKVDVERIKYTKEDHSLDILVTPDGGQFDPQDVSFRQSVGRFDAIMGFDIPSLEHLGTVFQEHPYLFSDIPLVNFSIHPSYDQVGKLNLCYPECSSMCEIIYEYLQYVRLDKYSKELSTVLMTGLLSSTESFLNNHASGAGFDMASALQTSGAAQSDIIEHVFKQKSFTTLKMWGKVLQSVSLDQYYKVVWGRVRASEFDALGADMKDLDDITRTMLRFVEGVDVAMLCIEHDGKVICELRSTKESYDFSFAQDLDAQIQYLDGGIDIVFEKGAIGALEAQILKALCGVQMTRLRLEEDRPIEVFDYKIALDKPADKKYPKTSIKHKKSYETGSLSAPDEVPFEVKGIKIVPESELNKPAKEDPKQEKPKPKKTPQGKEVPGWLNE